MFAAPLRPRNLRPDDAPALPLCTAHICLRFALRAAAAASPHVPQLCRQPPAMLPTRCTVPAVCSPCVPVMSLPPPSPLFLPLAHMLSPAVAASWAAASLGPSAGRFGPACPPIWLPCQPTWLRMRQFCRHFPAAPRPCLRHSRRLGLRTLPATHPVSVCKHSA